LLFAIDKYGIINLMPVKQRRVRTKRVVKKASSVALTDRILIKGSWFLTTFILILITIVCGIAFGTFFFNFVSKGVYAHVERTVNLTADTCQAPSSPKQILSVNATAYSSSPGQTDSTPCITATGFDVCENYALYGSANTLASNFLPVHTIVKIPELYGDQIFVVRDRMNPRYGLKNVDIWMPTYSEARRFGNQEVTIEIY
jgi:3D (Asp-Asp-Asp) domain-containing protein